MLPKSDNQIKELLLDLLELDVPEVWDVIHSKLKHFKIQSYGNNFLLLTPHNLQREVFLPLLVSHVDTVGKDLPSVVVIHNKWQNEMADCLGADDRAGVAACLTLADKLSLPVLFTDGEEKGGIGAKEAINDADFLTFCSQHVSCLVEFDREGCNHYVVYDDTPDSLQEILEEAGLNEEYGTYSDISTITPAVRLPSFNLSIGYYNQHTPSEFLSIPAFFFMLRLAERDILPRLVQSKPFPYVQTKRKTKWGSVSYLNDWKSWWDEKEGTTTASTPYPSSFQDEEEREPLVYCDYCGRLTPESELGEWVDDKYVICETCEREILTYTDKKK